MKKRVGKPMKRIMSVLLAVAMLVTTVEMPAVRAEGPEVPEFGSRTEDWDYNRVKAIGSDRVYAIYHNEYLEYKSFSPFKFDKQAVKLGINQIYFEFSSPYNCEADIQLYRLENTKWDSLVRNGEVIDTAEFDKFVKSLDMFSPLYMGNLVGRYLNKSEIVEKPMGEIELELKGLTFESMDKSRELKKIPMYGYGGKNPAYTTLEEYYAYKGIEAPQPITETEEALIEEPEMSVEETSESEETAEELEQEEPKQEESETEIQEENTVSVNLVPVLAEVPDADVTLFSVSENTAEEEKEPLLEEEEVLESSVSENAVAKEVQEDTAVEEEIVYPEDFYITTKDCFAEDTKSRTRAVMPTNIIHNYIVWNGTYVDKMKQIHSVSDENAAYIIVVQPVGRDGTPESVSLAEMKTGLPFAIGEPTITGSNGEEVQAFQKEVYGDRMLYITLATAMGGDPVDLVTGSLEWSYTDLSMEGEEPLDFTRSYSSLQADITGPLGNGWTHPYNYHLESFYGTVSMTLPSGTRMDFVQDYDGTYAKAPGSAYTLENVSGGWLLSHSDGTKIRFDGTGLPVEMTDIHEDITTLENDGSCITKITTKTGAFGLSYEGSLLAAVTDNAGRSVRYTYNGTDLASMTNPDGDTMTFSYDGSHNLTCVTGLTGEEMLSNTYNGEHQVVSQTLPDLGTYTYAYDKAGRTTTHTAENGLTQTIVYDEKNRIVQDTDNDGTCCYTYDDASRRTSETDRRGNTTAYTYAGDTTNIETVTYPDGTTESYTYNEKNQPLTKKQKDGTLLAFTYDAHGNRTSYTDALGNTYSYEYDSHNYCTRETDPLGNTTAYTYNSAGCPLTVTDPLGNTTVCTYDGVGRILTETSPEGKTTSYAYSPGGKLLTVTDPAGAQETYAYTGNGFATSETDKRGNSASYTYSAMNRMESAADREGNQTFYTYDKNGEKASETDAEGNNQSFTYDYKGRKTTGTDGNGNTSSYTYDANGNRTGSTTAEGYSTSASYDSMSRVTASTDASGGKTSCTYDAMGRLLTVTDGEGGMTSYTYDANGNVTGVTNARGFTTAYTYDNANRLVSRNDALGSTTAYVYDSNGQCIKTMQKDATETASSYDKDGNLIQSTDAAGGENSYVYDALGRVISTTDVLGNTGGCTYDANGNLLTVTDANGSTLSYTYDKENRPATMTDAEGGKTVYTYQKNGWLSATRDAEGGVTSYTYDGAGNIIEIKDPMGYTVTYGYDKDGRAVSATDANGNVTGFSYDGNGNLITVTSPDGGVEHYTYDHNDRLTGYTDGEGYSTAYAYDANGNLVKVTDARGNACTTEYDALDRQTVTTNALGGQVLLTYDSMDRVVKAVNEDGAVTDYAYDVLGRVTKMTDALGNSISYTYDGAGNLLSVTDQAGTTRSYTYDKTGHVRTYTDGLGAVTSYEYDKNYNLIKTTDSAGAETRYEYDRMNRVVRQTDALGSSESFTYDKNGRIIGVTDKNGNQTDYTLDGNGNILCRKDALGHPSCFEYDSMNRLTRITLYAGEDAEGLTGEQVTLYTYDHRGLVTTEINAAGNGKYYVYDELGNLVSTTDEDGYVTTHTYDALGRLSGTDYNGTKQAAFLYNGTGELVEMTDWNGTTTIKRDLLNRIEEVKDHNRRVTGYTWDSVGNVTAIEYPRNLGTASYTYDAEGRQLTATGTDQKTFTFTYDSTGNCISKLFPNGEMERYQYDSLHQMVRMDEYALNGRQKTYTEYTYDANGNRTGDCNRVPATPTVNYAYAGNKGTWGGEWNTYTYDALNRLTKEYENDTALTILYAYDCLGNKTYEKNSQDVKRYTYNELNQLVTKEAYNRTTNYEYDKRGNRILETSIHTQENRRTFAWDETSHLVQGTRGPDYGLYTSEYTYNGLGLRVNSTIMGPDKTVYDREYTIDYTSPERNDLAEYNMGRYQWQGDKKVHDLAHFYNQAGQRLQTESTRYVDWAGAKKYVRYIHEDVMGSSYYYTDPETGYITNKHEYTTWGNNTKAPTYNYDPEYRASEPYFTGHPYDGSLNLYYAEARFYDPETGSFLSTDPAKSGLNWYAYCGSNPTTYVDVLGLVPTTIKEDDPFFFKKMQDSGGHAGALLNEIDSITLDAFIGINMGSKDAWKEQQLLTAKYLTFFMMLDPFFTEKEYGREMLYAIVGNMFCEAYPGKTEQYNYDKTKKFNDIYNNDDYMQATLQETDYRSITIGCGGWANQTAIIQSLYQLPNKGDIMVPLKNGDTVDRQGFGFGMLQYTFSRATDVMEVYLDLYSCCKDELTMGQCFAAEYHLLRSELGGSKGDTYSFDGLVEESKNSIGGTSIYSLGSTFRDIYENPGDNSQGEGGARAEKWYQLADPKIREALK